MSGTPMSFWPLGRGAARARRSVPGRELDARSRNGAVDHRGQRGAALQYRRWRHLRLRPAADKHSSLIPPTI